MRGQTMSFDTGPEVVATTSNRSGTSWVFLHELPCCGIRRHIKVVVVVVVVGRRYRYTFPSGVPKRLRITLLCLYLTTLLPEMLMSTSSGYLRREVIEMRSRRDPKSWP